MGMNTHLWLGRKERWLLLLFLGLTYPIVIAPNCGPPDPPPPPEPLPEEHCSHYDPLRQPFFGDLHAHTAFSLDAAVQGTRLEPDEAYDFAAGITVGIQPHDENGNALRTLTIDRPLDFAVVADHAEFLGEISICTSPSLPGYDSPQCRMYRDNPRQAFFAFNATLSTDPPTRVPEVCGTEGLCVDESITLWDEIQQAAEGAHDRTAACTFSSFVGYEWTKSTFGKNLHRNVVFRNDIVPERATSFFEAPNVELLWDALEADCGVGSSCEFLTIPHNSNLSGGLFFELEKPDGSPYDQAFAARRQLHEPLIEVIQHKGQSECIPASSPNDEACGFEELPFSTLAATQGLPSGPPVPQDFVREALKEGLAFEQSTGANPFKYGMVGGTDTHLATPGAVREAPRALEPADPPTEVLGYPGHGGAGAPAGFGAPGLIDNPEFNPGGLTVIWAEENSRDSLFDAMRRREVYATSGTRPIVRFFGGFSNQVWTACSQGEAGIATAYEEGVPMGGDLGPAPPEPNHFPYFAVNVLKDPMGSDIQQVQFIKAWVDENGVTHEEVSGWDADLFDAGVNLDTCEPTGTSGYTERCDLYVDSDFNPAYPTFYYVRVLENPTCRWHKYQCNAAGIDCSSPLEPGDPYAACCDGSVPDTIQERAWTSPIWYRP